MGWRSIVTTCAAVVCLATLSVAMASSSRAVAAGQKLVGQASVQELAERLLAFPAPDGQAASLQLLPGQVASQLPVNLALPSGARVVGSLVRNAGAPTASVSVVLDAPGERASIQAFYQKELASKGWNPPPPGPQAHGFQTGSQPAGPSFFCSPQGNTWLSINIYAGRAGAVTSASIPTDRSPTSATHPAPRHPHLSAATVSSRRCTRPMASSLQTNGGGGGPGRWSSDGTATTDQNAGALEGHFAQQLQAAKWTRLDGRDDGMLAWSAWKLPVGDWQGLLYVVNGLGQNRRLLHVDAQSANAQQGSGSWTAFATGQAVAVSAPVAAAVPAAPVAKPPVAPKPASSAPS